MKKQLQILTVLVFVIFTANAQDTIRFTDGTYQAGRVEEVNSTLIKYKRFDNLDGPIFSVPISRVQMITYQNGSRDFFNQARSNPVQNPVQQIPQTVSPAAIPTVAPQRSNSVKFSGPRLGVTAITDGTVATYIRDRGKVPVVSQFGWQFETRIFTSVNNITGLVEFVPLIAGLEQGMFLPSGNLLFGLRGKDGFELAAGPNLSLSGFGLVFAVGTSFHFDDVYFPVNIAFVPSVSSGVTTVSYTGQRTTITERSGHRITLLIGFNTRKRY